jgi:hypothetical protein
MVQSQLHRDRLITMWLRLVRDVSSHILVKLDRQKEIVLRYKSQKMPASYNADGSVTTPPGPADNHVAAAG